jgi:HEAT repeat protein
MVLFKLLLATSVTSLGWVPFMPNQSPAMEIARSETFSALRVVRVVAVSDAVPHWVELETLQTAQQDESWGFAVPLASAETLLTPRSNRIDSEQMARWAILAVIPVGVVGTLLYCLRQPSIRQKPHPHGLEGHSPTATSQLPIPQLSTEEIPVSVASEKSYNPVALRSEAPLPKQATKSQVAETTVAIRSNLEATEAHLPDDATVTQTTRISKVDIVEALIKDLHHPEVAQRRKSIWELGQRGDSRAIQPLVDLLVDADSQQRSLILAAIAEISTRTLKPMHRALLMSLQDESADVRKNAIRDITRIYDQMTQISQLLQYAASDADAEVQETACWALGQLNRLRTAPEQEQLKPSQPNERPSIHDPRSGEILP